ncbi:serine/threonine-protein kinase RsbW [Edaphobacter aggregans]|uniref:Serine/threonine-protein kinase RsbW n=1 Tax=Edaphobacter aggregans TaxID=570835 RepID=A0A3R9NY10_9BACT|nr:ATP-binding protein [Edaphobacter aggregans]RSL16441.1 serine/threonine-protein kinase RsbW [Edaphobacter aggregans]
MTKSETGRIQDRIVLRSELSEMSRIFPWIEALASEYEIVESLQFAINLCLEEAVSNVIRHGYANQVGSFIAVHFLVSSEGNLVFTVDDDAPPFNPLEAQALPVLDEQGETRIGGHGIRLIRGFADMLEYEPTSTGNRLQIAFSKSVSPAPTK